MLGTLAASSMSELVSVTTVPPADAGALSATVQVAELPLPPAMTDGLQVSELPVCADALEARSVHVIRAIAARETRRFVARVEFTGGLLNEFTENLRHVGEPRCKVLAPRIACAACRFGNGAPCHCDARAVV